LIIYKNKFIIITFVLQCADKKWNFHYTKIKIIKLIIVVVQNIDLFQKFESQRNKYLIIEKNKS
jgi:hypothetical protein